MALKQAQPERRVGIRTRRIGGTPRPVGEKKPSGGNLQGDIEGNLVDGLRSNLGGVAKWWLYEVSLHQFLVLPKRSADEVYIVQGRVTCWNGATTCVITPTTVVGQFLTISQTGYVILDIDLTDEHINATPSYGDNTYNKVVTGTPTYANEASLPTGAGSPDDISGAVTLRVPIAQVTLHSTRVEVEEQYVQGPIQIGQQWAEYGS